MAMQSKLKLIGAVGTAFVAGTVMASNLDWVRPSIAQVTSPRAAASGPRDDGGAPGFADMAERVTPAVVSIRVQSSAPRTARGRALPRGQVPPGMEEFFEQFQGRQRNEPVEGSGTGFIISRDGYILTNNHVVEGADKITVSLLDRRSFEAKLVGRDPTTDVAVIRISGSDFPTLPIGNDNAARIGSWVIAVGNPLGLDFTVTAGIISAKGRGVSDLPRQTRYAITDFIQTDAAINPGNSGGPLLNARGEVIGVNSAIASQTGYYSGYGFAIPISLAKLVADDLIQFGRVRRAVLGISIRDVNPEEATAAGLRTPSGVLVGNFDPAAPSSPAKDAGIQAGDVIVAIDGTVTDHPGALQRYIRSKRPGDVVTVEAMRFGEKKTFKVRLIEAPAEPEQVATTRREAGEDPAPGSTVSADRLGITVAPLTTEAARAAEVPSSVQGVRVMDVNPSGSAWRKLFAQGDIITEVVFPRPRRAIRTPAELTQVVSGLKAGDVLTLTVYNIQGKETRVETLRVGGN